MTDTVSDPLALLSDRLAALVESAARSVVAVHGGRRSTISGIHWRPGILVTAEEALERDEEIALTLPDGRRAVATLAGRDPSTDVAVLRFPPDGLPVADGASAAGLRPGHVVLAIGRHEDGVIASQGIAGFVGGAWQSMRGGKIDHFLRLDLALSRSAEGGALVDASGRVLGMAVLGRGGRALAIPGSTIERAVDQLLAKGHVARGYLGARLQPVKHGRAAEEGRGVLIVSVDPDGPAARAGLLVGDIITQWNGAPTGRVRDIMRSLGTDSVGTTAELTLLRGGNAQKLSVTLGERALA